MRGQRTEVLPEIGGPAIYRLSPGLEVDTTVLYAIGYPVSRSGVVPQVGQYQLLVADACAGLHTLFVLEAMDLLYLNLVRYASPIRNIGLAILIVPVSFLANVMRVMVLCHLGDEAGQGFLHGFAGIALFVSALLLITSLDALFRSLSPGAATAPRAESAAAQRHGIALLAVCVATAAAAWAATPRAGAQAPPPPLAELIPNEFAGWQTDIAACNALIVNPEQQALLETLYSDTLSRTYIHTSGRRVMLSLAYGANQSRATQVHRPEVCYPAQGFALGSLSKVTLDGAGAPPARLPHDGQPRPAPRVRDLLDPPGRHRRARSDRAGHGPPALRPDRPLARRPGLSGIGPRPQQSHRTHELGRARPVRG